MALEVVSAIDAPSRFVHGDKDEIVPLSNSQELYEHANDPKDMHVVEGADHLFRSKQHQDAMVAATVEWMETHL